MKDKKDQDNQRKKKDLIAAAWYNLSRLVRWILEIFKEIEKTLETLNFQEKQVRAVA